MTFLIVLITILLILDCLLLGLLILIQLPKKEAGVGVAFGGGATDALFGAGSGTALSNLTKYTSTAFFILVILLSVVNAAKARHAGVSELQQQMEKQSVLPLTTPTTTSPSAPAPATTPATGAKPVIPLTISTNNVLPLTAPATNPPAK